MSNANLKKLLTEAYQTESELIELLEQCFKEIFQDKAPVAICQLKDDISFGLEVNGCLQSLSYYKRQYK